MFAEWSCHCKKDKKGKVIEKCDGCKRAHAWLNKGQSQRPNGDG